MLLALCLYAVGVHVRDFCDAIAVGKCFRICGCLLVAVSLDVVGDAPAIEVEDIHLIVIAESEILVFAIVAVVEAVGCLEIGTHCFDVF